MIPKRGIKVVILCAILCALSVHDLPASFVFMNRPVIHAGVFDDSPPFHFVKDGSLAGFDIDLIKIAADNVGYDVEFNLGDEDGIMNGLASGAYDIVIDVVRNREMESRYALSITTSVITYGAFVKSDRIRTENDLVNSRIAMSEGVLKMGIFPRPHTVNVFTYADSGEKVFRELERGNVDAVIFPELRGREICRKMNLAEVRQLENYNISEERCVAAAKNNAKLIRSINTGISLMKEKGQFFNLYMRWFLGKDELLRGRIFKWIISISILLMVLFAISLFFVQTLRKHVRRRTRELAASEAKYRILVDNIPQSIFVKDRRSEYITCNDNFADDLGVKCDEVKGKSDYDYYPPDLADKYRCDDSRIMETGVAECLIEEYLSRGRRRWIHTVKTPMRNEKGEITGILGIIWDITENKIREDELRESERRLSMAERVANVGSWELDVSTGAMIWSKQLFRILGSEPDFRPKTIEELLNLLHEDDRQAVRGGLCSAMNSESVISLTVRVVKSGGLTIWIELRGESVSDHSGNVVKVVGSVLDITDMKRAAEKIQESLEEKESLIRELYHRTKNNMQVICSMLSFRTREIKDESIRTVFNDMKNRIYSMALVHQKLYSSKSLSRINLREYVVELTGTVIRSYEHAHGNISTRFLIEDVFVSIDTAIPFGVALHELVANSCKYAFAAGEEGEVFISLHKNSEGVIEFIISDNGAGVELADGFPVNSRMGLKTAYALICDQLHGEIHAESDNGLKYRICFRDLEKKHRY